MAASAMATAASRRRSAQKSAMAAIQNARNGTSASKELPLTTKAGTARKRRTAQRGFGENRRASDHMAAAAMREKTMYAAWKGTSRTPLNAAISGARNQPAVVGWEWPRRS